MKASKTFAIIALLVAILFYGLSFVFGFANMMAEAGSVNPRPCSPYLILILLMGATVFLVLWVWLSEISDKGE